MPDINKNAPLAVRMRPQTLEDIKGQEKALNPNSILYKMIKCDRLSSIILYGPPGTGKTTIANVIANETNARFTKVNAVSAGKKDLEAICVTAKKEREESPDKKTILFIDEIHRFNKIQQDYLLPFVEDGVVTLIGATTENPFFEVNPALVSRSTIVRLEPLRTGSIQQVILKALNDPRGLKDMNLDIELDAMTLLSEQANGDARFALSILELAAIQTGENNTIQVDTVKEIIQKPHLHYDKDGDKHYDTISAFIKSMRGSDPDACLYWLARMIESGEDPKYIARRIMICASEDVGNADPMALVIATNAALAAERVGFPEASIILSQAVLYIAMAPKSNSACMGIQAAMEYLKQHPSNDIPLHLRDCHYKSAVKLGHGVDYVYPHDYPDHYVIQNYLPEDVPANAFYNNSGVGYEASQDNYHNKRILNAMRRKNK